tara:strand:+ start:506 stop:1201 length:696 start_codon:yes stop_codon:yes gene_type:complete
MDLSIILPTFNEKGNIQKLIEQIIQVVPSSLKKELIVIDDNSADGTYEYCKKNNQYNNEINVILRNEKRSLGGSIGDGIKICSGQIIVIMDTDLSHDPKHLKEILELLKTYDIVNFSRYCGGGSMQNKFHFYGSYYYNILLKIILGLKTNDNTGGYFAIKKSFLDLLNHKKIFYGYGEYFFRLLYFAKKENSKIIEIPTFYNMRTYGKSKTIFSLMLFKYLYAALIVRLKG